MKKQKCTSIQNYLEKCAKNNETNPDNIKDAVIRIIFDDKTSVEHIIPLRSLSITSYVVNIKIGSMTPNQFLDEYQDYLKIIANSFIEFYSCIGLKIIEVEFIITSTDNNRSVTIVY